MKTKIVFHLSWLPVPNFLLIHKLWPKTKTNTNTKKKEKKTDQNVLPKSKSTICNVHLGSLVDPRSVVFSAHFDCTTKHLVICHFKCAFDRLPVFSFFFFFFYVSSAIFAAFILCIFVRLLFLLLCFQTTAEPVPVAGITFFLYRFISVFSYGFCSPPSISLSIHSNRCSCIRPPLFSVLPSLLLVQRLLHVIAERVHHLHLFPSFLPSFFRLFLPAHSSPLISKSSSSKTQL